MTRYAFRVLRAEGLTAPDAQQVPADVPAPAALGGQERLAPAPVV